MKTQLIATALVCLVIGSLLSTNQAESKQQPRKRNQWRGCASCINRLELACNDLAAYKPKVEEVVAKEVVVEKPVVQTAVQDCPSGQCQPQTQAVLPSPKTKSCDGNCPCGPNCACDPCECPKVKPATKVYTSPIVSSPVYYYSAPIYSSGSCASGSCGPSYSYSMPYSSPVYSGPVRSIVRGTARVLGGGCASGRCR